MEVSKFSSDSFVNTSATNDCDIMEELHTTGSTCNTYRAKIYGKLIFIKKLKPEYAGNILYREALQKEFETGFRLEHPNLARYIALQGDSIHIEYIDGETLTERLATNPHYFANRENCDKFIRQLLWVAQYLHTNQTLHLDIKPDNILLTRINNDVKLVDLGFCRTDCFTGSTGHTEQFAAPEQLNNTGIDERSDIYALGRIIELLPNRHIYNKVITRCTARDKELRYKTVEEIITDLPRKRGKRFATAVTVFAMALIALILPGIIHQYKIEKEFETMPYYERVATQEEFEQFKTKLNLYYNAVTAFVNDSSNLQKYPSYHSYCNRYNELMREATKEMQKDEWTYMGFKSVMNPVSTYRAGFLEDLDTKMRNNADRLP